MEVKLVETSENQSVSKRNKLSMIMVVLPDSTDEYEPKELRGDPTIGPRPKVWTRDQRWK